MEAPPLTDAPLEWLEAVVGDLTQESDDLAVDITIQEAEKGIDHTFSYRLGDIRAEHHKRTAN
jgi:hypothetical protein